MELKAYQARVLRNHKNDIPELQEQLKQNEYAMKAEFKESALSLRIPQFSIPVQLPLQFVFDEAEEENSCAKFYKESLLQGFELSKEDTKKQLLSGRGAVRNRFLTEPGPADDIQENHRNGAGKHKASYL